MHTQMVHTDTHRDTQSHMHTHRLPSDEWLVGKRREGARLPWQHILGPDQALLALVIWQLSASGGLLRTPTPHKGSWWLCDSPDSLDPWREEGAGLGSEQEVEP